MGAVGQVETDPGRVRRWARRLLLGAALAGACAGPNLTVTARPSDSILFVDGRRQPAFETLGFRYYGRTRLRLEPEERESGNAAGRDVTRIEAIPEPVTPWIFPLDFLAELVLYPLSGPDDRRVELVLPEVPAPVIAGQEPELAATVRARGLAARSRR